MLDPSHFDRAPLVSCTVSPRLIKEFIGDDDTFVRFCALENVLDNYIAVMCICAFNKSPSLLRLQTFYAAFLKKESPLGINLQDKDFASVVRLATVTPTYKRNWRGIYVAEALPRTAFNSLMKLILLTIKSDTYERYSLLSTCSESRDTMERVKNFTTNDQDVIKGLNILESGGWPVRHMSLSKIVIGF